MTYLLIAGCSAVASGCEEVRHTFFALAQTHLKNNGHKGALPSLAMGPNSGRAREGMAYRP